MAFEIEWLESALKDLDAEIEYYKASTEVEQSNEKIKALDIISDMR